MLDGIAESASDWFLACNFVKGLGTPLPSDYLIGHEYVVCEMLLNELARPRTFPQHTLPLLPLLRSRPGGVHKACVVRSPGSDKLPIADFQLPILFSIGNRQSQIGNPYISVFRCASIRKSPLISRCAST